MFCKRTHARRTGALPPAGITKRGATHRTLTKQMRKNVPGICLSIHMQSTGLMKLASSSSSARCQHNLSIHMQSKGEHNLSIHMQSKGKQNTDARNAW
jgi:hypothetical protein